MSIHGSSCLHPGLDIGPQPQVTTAQYACTCKDQQQILSACHCFVQLSATTCRYRHRNILSLATVHVKEALVMRKVETTFAKLSLVRALHGVVWLLVADLRGQRASYSMLPENERCVLSETEQYAKSFLNLHNNGTVVFLLL